MEGEIISRQKIDFQAIPAAGLHGVGLRSLPGNLSRLIRGYRKATRIIRDFCPDVLFFTGGYLAVPAAFAGRSVPSLVFIPDIEPGLAIKTIARLAARIAVTADESKRYIPATSPIFVSGYPVRKSLLSWNREDALETLGLSPDLPVLLVFGGSKGARSINQAAVKILTDLLKESQVVHIAGKLDWKDMSANRDRLTANQQKKYRLYPFLHEEMGAALRAADLVVSRSGASILGEYPIFGLPAILVPYPHAWRYQKTNAQYLADRDAAEIIEDANLSEQLLSRVQALFRDQERLANMSKAMSELARPKAAETIAHQLVLLSQSGSGGLRI